MITACAGSVVKATAAIGARKLADWNRQTIHNGHRWIIKQQVISDQTLQPFFHCPHVGCLPHKRTAIDVRHRWKKVRVVTAAGVKHFLILTGASGRFRPLRSSRRALSAIFGIGPRSRKRFPFVAVGSISSIRQKHVIIKSDCLHGVPPQKIGKSSEDSRLHEPFPLQVLLAHRVR
jgi:hypothetical protein